MASHEHLQQLSASSTSEDDATSSEDDESSPATPEVSAGNANAIKPRIKVSLRMTLPTSKKTPVKVESNGENKPKDDVTKDSKRQKSHIASKGTKKSKKIKKEGGDVAEVKATVVDSDEAAEDDAVVAFVEPVEKDGTPSESKVVSSGSNRSSAVSAMSKRKLPSSTRPIRLPTISSPGLLIAPTSGVHRGAIDSTGFASPSGVFDHAMSMAGYTTEERTRKPHRGSSVKRVVGDMFDTNVALSRNFPELVPSYLLQFSVEESANKMDLSDKNGNETSRSEKLPDLLLQSLDQGIRKDDLESNGEGETEDGNKRRKLLAFRNMIPVSLIIPYPDNYIAKHLDYMKKVDAREEAIIAYQEAKEQRDLANDPELNDTKSDSKDSPTDLPSIPDIPERPKPPRLAEIEGWDTEAYDDCHPLYPPKGKGKFVAHLDKLCHHITEGRYFGLATNLVADPHFVGPNAPGIVGLTVSCGSGLATASGGGGANSGSSATTSALSSSYNGANGTSTSGKDSKSKKPTTNSDKPSSSGKNSRGGSPPAATMADLKTIMEQGGKAAEDMKKWIIRSAVHASRTGKHGQSFLGPDGKTYPDVSKAFAAHAGLRPCTRCKNNKQGAYHCRLRRKHKELDYDGGNSPAALAPLFEEDMDGLLWKPEKGGTT